MGGRRHAEGIDSPGKRPVETVLTWLIHPVTVAATALLILNDHVLKSAYPGWLTGKLSDVAGLVMAPPLLAMPLALLLALVGRPSGPGTGPGTGLSRRLEALRRTRWSSLPGPGRDSADLLALASILLVGAGFTAVKASPAGAAAASAAWSIVNGPSVILADVTDLLSLPALGVAWWTWRSAAARPSLTRWLRMVAVLVVLPIAGLAVAATSAPDHSDAVAIGEWQGDVIVGIDNAYGGGPRTARSWDVSKDDGRTFSPLPHEEVGRLLTTLPSPLAGGQDCSVRNPGHCFRVVPRQLAVEESRDGGTTWQSAWQVDEAARERLATAIPGVTDVQEYLSSRALVVRDQPDGGVVVLVANGQDGFARRDSTGNWERIGFGTMIGAGYQSDHPATPIPSHFTATREASLPVAIPLSVAVGCLVAGIGFTVLLIRRHGPLMVAPTAILGLPILAGVALFFRVVASPGDREGLNLLAIVTVGLTLTPVAILLMTVMLDRRTRAAAGGIHLAALLAAGAVWLPYVVRLVTSRPSQATATTSALGIAVGVGLAGIIFTSRYAVRRLPPRQAYAVPAQQPPSTADPSHPPIDVEPGSR